MKYLAGGWVADLVFMSCTILLKKQSRERLKYVKLIIKKGVSKTRNKQMSDSAHIDWHEVFLLNKLWVVRFCWNNNP